MPIKLSVPTVTELASPTSGPSPFAILEMIFLQGQKKPQATAIAFANRAVSYLELVSRSNALATRLRAAGLVSGGVVGIYLESSVDLVVAALATWKAGGAYLPIDPAYPVDRAAYICADSGVQIVLSRQSLVRAIGKGTWQAICIDDELFKASGGSDVFVPVTSDDLAYVIYTSGSTGKPKGVELTHGNLRNLVEWHNTEFLVTSNDRAAQIAGPGFDAAVWELWPYLAAGAAIHFPSQETRISAVKLRDWLIAEKITISFVPTVLAEEMIRLPWPASTCLRLMLTGGDTLHTFPPKQIPFQLVNNYGPTECTVVATSGLADGSKNQSLPDIGKPILNTSIYLLDESGGQVPDGDVGEIYIGGSSVGRGYRNRPDLTDASFVLVTIEGVTERTFRTGDLARRLPGGQLAFVGRTDEQVKIRGFRVEPDEIACVINRHPLIVSSAVIVRTDHVEKRLVAYVVTVSGVEIWDHDLRDSLNRDLPDYMVPTNFVLLEHIPVTANGKVDKASLPAPTEKNQIRRDRYVAPRNGLEEIIEGILRPILRLTKISTDGNFFLLGGHSLMGAQVIAKVRDIFDVELSLRNIFECPTIAKLAAKIEALLMARLEAMSEAEVHQALQDDSSVAQSSTIKAC